MHWRSLLPASAGRCARIALVALLASPACTRTQAKVTPDAPLEVPPPPPRDVEVSDSEPPPPATLVPEPARNAPARVRPTTREPRAETPRPEPPTAEPPPSEPPKPIEEPKPPTPQSTLQTTPPSAEGEVERAIRAALAHANTDLNRVDYRALNNDARTQYNTAKRFVEQADRALREKNLVFAKSVADKAAALAAQLAGR